MYKYFFKRVFDFIIALIFMPIVFVIIGISAIFIKIEDKGPVFYRARRIGRNGKIFSMLKLRTMQVNAPDIRLEDGSTYNSSDDPRVTRFGKFARKTSIDELPQLLNVLAGQMALIGPRPDSAGYIDKYTESEKVILDVRPGITGYNQAINRNSVLTKEKLQNDIYYVENLSFWLDIKIIFLTVKSVFSHKDIYRKSDIMTDETCKKETSDSQDAGKTVMILGASVLQLPAIKKAKSMGLRTVVVDMNSDAVGFKEAGIIKEIVSTTDKVGVLEAAKRNAIDGIMTLASDMPMQTVAYVAHALGLIGISEDTALKATDKYYMREALKKHGVPIPSFYKTETLEEYLKCVETNFSDSFIVKPADNSGSRGISLVEDRHDSFKVEEAFRYAKRFSRNGAVIVEEFMRGAEVSVETLTVDGICHVIQITDKLTTGAPHFVETGHSQPSRLDENTLDKIKKIAIDANRAIGIDQGPSHTEIIVTEQGPKIVELGARLGGDCITTHLVPLSTGVNMVESCLKIALGEKPDIDIKFNKGSAIRYFNQRECFVQGIKNLDDAKKVKGIKNVTVVHGVGEKISNICDSASRMGFVIAQDDNADLAIKDCETALNKITIDISDLQ